MNYIGEGNSDSGDDGDEISKEDIDDNIEKFKLVKEKHLVVQIRRKSRNRGGGSYSLSK